MNLLAWLDCFGCSYSSRMLENAPEGENCSICLDREYGVEGADPILLNCSHAFHRECIATWVDEGYGSCRNACPTCRTVVDLNRLREDPEMAPLLSSDVGNRVRDYLNEPMSEAGLCTDDFPGIDYFGDLNVNDVSYYSTTSALSTSLCSAISTLAAISIVISIIVMTTRVIFSIDGATSSFSGAETPISRLDDVGAIPV